jgi:hypothetical protein
MSLVDMGSCRGCRLAKRAARASADFACRYLPASDLGSRCVACQVGKEKRVHAKGAKGRRAQRGCCVSLRSSLLCGLCVKRNWARGCGRWRVRRNAGVEFNNQATSGRRWGALPCLRIPRGKCLGNWRRERRCGAGPAIGGGGRPGFRCGRAARVSCGAGLHHGRFLAAFPGKTIIATGGGLALEDAPLDPLDMERTARRVRRMARSLHGCLRAPAPNPCERCLLGQG